MSRYNIITGILNIIKYSPKILGTSNNIHNSIQAMGEPLEEYIKDIFSDSIGLNREKKLLLHNEAFSFGGGTNNPPDAIIKNGDAIEVKKVESIGSIALNSSYPKSMLYRDDTRLSSYCRNIENGNWVSKDIIYAIGCINQRKLKSLCFVYGSVYCADREYYENVFNNVKECLNNSSLSLVDTNELAHVNAVDPLGITYFRARGMWGIYHPFKVFDYIYEYNKAKNFCLMAIIPTDKFETFENKDVLISLSESIGELSILDKRVKNPNNTAQLINVKLITYTI